MFKEFKKLNEPFKLLKLFEPFKPLMVLFYPVVLLSYQNSFN
jgi:hypothetical protein